MIYPDRSAQDWSEIQVDDISFLGEQDGEPERLLKEQLVEMFIQNGNVRRAYLVQISIGQDLGVALCLLSRLAGDKDIVRESSRIFAHIFGEHEHLDILFVNKDQDLRLASMSIPFFEEPTTEQSTEHTCCV